MDCFSYIGGIDVTETRKFAKRRFRNTNSNEQDNEADIEITIPSTLSTSISWD